MTERLYVVVRADLPPGLQITQAMHAAREFAEHYREIEQDWFVRSNTLSVLSEPDESALRELYDAAGIYGIARARFLEPDLDNQMTAVALAPGDLSARLLRGLRPALEEF